MIRYDTIRYDTIRYTFTAIEFSPGEVVLPLVHKRQRSVIHTRRDNADHRTHKTENKTYETVKQN
jgi:hypothetical protein